jgi:hypothetical protein
MFNLLISYLLLRNHRKSIEASFDSNSVFNGDTNVALDIQQHGKHLSIVQIYCLAWMIARVQKTLSLTDIKDMTCFKNFHNLDQFKELKSIANRKKVLNITDILDLSYQHRYNYPSEHGYHVQERNRMFLKSKDLHTKHLSRIKAYADLSWPTTKSVMTFELDHLDILRCEPMFGVNYEVYKNQNNILNWPKSSSENKIKFGWVIFWVDSNMSVNISEFQSPCESVNKTRNGVLHHFVEPLNWTGFMLEQFIQYFVLRGFSRFSIPTLEYRKESTTSKHSMDSHYREIPKAFGFKRETKEWVLDFNL